jgi:hypothetical protein
MLEYDRPSACASFLHYTWKTISCLLSHITLVSMVVSYCVLGAFTFEALEVHHEKDVSIAWRRRNILGGDGISGATRMEAGVAGECLCGPKGAFISQTNL